MELDLDEEEEETDDESRSDVDAASENLTDAEGVQVPPPPASQRDPQERYMKQPDGCQFPPPLSTEQFLGRHGRPRCRHRWMMDAQQCRLVVLAAAALG